MPVMIVEKTNLRKDGECMKKIDILNNLNIGNSIAEYDKNIVNYYINTYSTMDLVNDRYDIIKGTKGSGKTAMLVTLYDNQSKYSQLDGKRLIKAIELKGDPDFKRAFNTVTINDNDIQKVIDAWKIYIINIIWKSYSDLFSDGSELGNYLQKEKLLSPKKTIIGTLLHALQYVKLKATNTFNPDGSTTQSVEFSPNSSYAQSLNPSELLIDYNHIFSELDSLICNNKSCFWVMIDRLDDAFPDRTPESTLILKALFYAYKDICMYAGFKMKIFIRDDIFNEITSNGFTSLTHVASKTMQSLQWDRENIEQLIVERLLFNDAFKEYISVLGINTDCSTLTSTERNKIINILIKPQIDVGKNNPDSLGWIINHVKDGHNHFTPRDIISLLEKARAIQLNLLQENNISEIADDFFISSPAIRAAYSETSREKLVTQLYAEYPAYRTWIELFKNSKAEHTDSTLQQVLGKRWKFRTEKLVQIGFLEKKKNTYKIPFIYRVQLNISQGKAK